MFAVKGVITWSDTFQNVCEQAHDGIGDEKFWNTS